MPSHIETRQATRKKSLEQMRLEVAGYMTAHGGMLRSAWAATEEFPGEGTFRYFEMWDYPHDRIIRACFIEYLTAIGEVLVFVAPEPKELVLHTIRGELSQLFTTKGV